MLVAKSETGQFIAAYKKDDRALEDLRKQTFTCPVCSSKVILKAGQVKIPHFAHHQDSECPNHQGESEAHLNGKIDIHQWCQQQGYPSTLEFALPEVNQRIDVVAQISDIPVAFEYQCSPISLEEFEARTQGMREAGFLPIWIFGESYLNAHHQHSFRLSPVLKSSIMTEPPFNQPTLLFYSPTKKQLTILTDFYASDYRSFVQPAFIPIQKFQIQHLNTRSFQVNPLLSYWLKEKRRFRTMQRKHTSTTDHQFMQYLYRHYLHPQYLPACIHLPNQSSSRLLTPNYVWQAHFLLDCWKDHKVGESITWTEALQACEPFFQKKITTQYAASSLHPLYEYLMQLTHLGYFTKTDEGWQVVKHPRYPKTLDEAVIYDRNIFHHLGETFPSEGNFFLQSNQTAIK